MGKDELEAVAWLHAVEVYVVLARMRLPWKSGQQVEEVIALEDVALECGHSLEYG